MIIKGGWRSRRYVTGRCLFPLSHVPMLCGGGYAMCNNSVAKKGVEQNIGNEIISKKC